MRDKIRKFEECRIITFSNRREMIQFVSKYLAIQYKKFLKMECATTMDSAEEEDYWEYKIYSNVSKFEKALKGILNIYVIFDKTIEMTNESDILKTVFKVIGETVGPTCCFEDNVKYRIKELTFEKIIY